MGRIITGPKSGDVVFVPRITMTPSDSTFPFTIQRHQFPVQVTYAMTVNKSQGQSLNRAGINRAVNKLPNFVFVETKL